MHGKIRFYNIAPGAPEGKFYRKAYKLSMMQKYFLSLLILLFCLSVALSACSNQDAISSMFKTNGQQESVNISGLESDKDLTGKEEAGERCEMKNDYPHYYRKIDSSLFPLIDKELLPEGRNLADYLQTMQKLGQFVPAGATLKHENMIAPADILYLQISIVEGHDKKSIEHLCFLITDSSEDYNLVIAWVKVDLLTGLAKTEAVQMVRPVIPPVTR